MFFFVGTTMICVALLFVQVASAVYFFYYHIDRHRAQFYFDKIKREKIKEQTHSVFFLQNTIFRLCYGPTCLFIMFILEESRKKVEEKKFGVCVSSHKFEEPELAASN